MAVENVFSGLKVVDLASFIAGPAATTILSDFGAEVIKVEPPGVGDPYRFLYKTPPNPASPENYAWHLTNRNKRGIALDLKSEQSRPVLLRLVQWADVMVTNFPPKVKRSLGLTYEAIREVNPRLIYADLTGYGEKGPDASLPGFDITAYWARSGLLSLTRDAGAPPTVPPSGSGDHATAVTLYSAIVTALYRRERTGKGSYVTTSLLAAGVWACAVFIQAALCDAAFFPLHDRLKPPNATLNVYRASDETWFLIVVIPDHWPALAKGIGRPDLLTDARFIDPAKQMANSGELKAVLNEVFATQPMSHWQEVFDQAHLTFGVVHAPSEVVKDPQLRENDIVVPIDGAGEKVKFTVSSPLTVHGVSKVAARRAPEIGEHNDELLQELGFSSAEIGDFRANGAIPHAQEAEILGGVR